MTIDRWLGPACIVGRAPVWERVRQVMLLGAAAVLVSAGCEGKSITDPQQAEESGFVSDPVVTGAPAGALTAVVSGEELVFVSLPPDSFPEAESAVITNSRSGSEVIASMVDGGLDPVSLPATIGDEIVLDVRSGTGETLAQMTVTVPKDRKPRIIRTSPARGKRDVPLNARIVIIFSEPIDGTTLTAASIRLLQGTTSVAGTAQFLDASLDANQVSVQFVPDAPLAAQTEYQLVVTSAVRDLDGDALLASESVLFSTGDSFNGPPAEIFLSGDTVFLAPGSTYQVTATVRDADGNTLTDHSITWSSSDPAVVTVSSSGLITAVGFGSAVVTATAGTVSSSLGVHVLPAPPASVTIEPTSVTVPARDTTLLTATVRDAEGRETSPLGLTWRSSNQGVAIIANPEFRTVNVIGVSPGTVTITATREMVSGTATVTVGPAVPVASVTVAPEAAPVLVGGTVQLSATLRDATGRSIMRPITWTTDNPNAATVNAAAVSRGIVTGVSEGSAIVTAASEAESDVSAITVTFIELASAMPGGSFSCGLATNGVAWCWGHNDLGQLGTGSRNGSPIATAVTGGLAFASVSPGVEHTCGVTTGGAAYCWGNGVNGQLGYGDFAEGSVVPVLVAGGITFTALTAASAHTCGLAATGLAYCWGDSRYGQLGTGSAGIASYVPVAVAGGLAFTGLSAGSAHTCGVTTSGTAYCWGGNEAGQLGDGSGAPETYTPLPVAVLGGLTFTAVSAGYYHSCGLVASGAAYCWGDNVFGQLGTGSTNSSPVPEAVIGGLRFSALSAGTYHTCGVAINGDAYCWGDNSFGKLGTESAESSSVPVKVSGGLTFTSVAAGIWHTCGRATTGGAYCWGDNGNGQLGVGSGIPYSPVPVRVAGQH